MSDQVVVLYASEAHAEEVRRRLFEMQQGALLELSDIVIGAKTAKGRVRLHQLFNGAAIGAASGALFGLLASSSFAVPLVGTIVSAFAGLIAGASWDYGLNDQAMRTFCDSLQPGNAALFLLVRKATMEKLLDFLKGTGGIVLPGALGDGKVARPREALASVVASRIEAPAE